MGLSIGSFEGRYNPLANQNNESISSKIAAELIFLSAKKRKVFVVEDSGNPVETYHYGNESARLIKRLCDACVGEEGSNIRYYAERSDYNRFNWWKTILDKFPISLLEISVDHLANDGQVSHPEWYFFPKNVVEHYKLNPENDEDREIACIQWVQDQVIETLNPALSPDFKVVFLEDHFRLVPLNQEVTLDDHTTYNRAKEVVLKAIGPLQNLYQKMSAKINEK